MEEIYYYNTILSKETGCFLW